MQLWKKLLVLTDWTIVHCSGCAVEPVCCWQDYQVRCPHWCTTSAAQSRTESPWAARSRLSTGSFSSVWAAGWEDSRCTETLITLTSSLYNSATVTFPCRWVSIQILQKKMWMNALPLPSTTLRVNIRSQDKKLVALCIKILCLKQRQSNLKCWRNCRKPGNVAFLFASCIKLNAHENSLMETYLVPHRPRTHNSIMLTATISAIIPTSATTDNSKTQTVQG